MNKRILVTGATGFVGAEMVRRLAAEGWQVRAAVRRTSGDWPATVETAFIKDIDADTDWRAALTDVDVVVHCAGRAHKLQDAALDPLEEFRRVNERGTLALARQAAEAGVRRFIFISTIGVNGSETADKPFAADDEPHPDSPYAVSKYEAEQGLHRLARDTGLEIVILRPPLIYGRNAPGNFGQLVKAVGRGLPLPLGAIRNKRSFVALGNLVDLVRICLEHPGAAGQVFLVSDGDDLSTSEFIRKIGTAMGKSSFLIPLPASLLHMLAKCAGKENAVKKLTVSLQLDIQKNKALLGWEPPAKLDQGMSEAVGTGKTA